MGERGLTPSPAPPPPDPPQARPDAQRRVDACFEAEVGFWQEVYGQPTVEAEIFRDRETAIIGAVAGLPLEPNATVLEVGSGAGRVAVELRRSFSVIAVDSVEQMAAATRAAAGAAAADQLPVGVADVHALPFGRATFSLVVAVGVVPWLHDPATALGEMRRVTRPGGFILFTSDNRDRLPHLLDPRDNPYLGPVRSWLRRRLVGIGLLTPRAEAGVTNRRFAPREIRAMARAAGIDVLRSNTVGFGPFTLLGHPLPLGRFGLRLHRFLQRLADAGVPLVRSTGSHQLVLGAIGADESGG